MYRAGRVDDRVSARDLARHPDHRDVAQSIVSSMLKSERWGRRAVGGCLVIASSGRKIIGSEATVG
jgi:hypothetical protein